MTEQTRFLSHECINLLPGLHIKNKSRPTFNNCFGPVPQSIITATAALLINHVMRGQLFYFFSSNILVSFSSNLPLNPNLNALSGQFFVFENWADGTALVQMIIVGAEKLHQDPLAAPPEFPRDQSWKKIELHIGQSWKTVQKTPPEFPRDQSWKFFELNIR